MTAPQKSDQKICDWCRNEKQTYITAYGESVCKDCCLDNYKYCPVCNAFVAPEDIDFAGTHFSFTGGCGADVVDKPETWESENEEEVQGQEQGDE